MTRNRQIVVGGVASRAMLAHTIGAALAAAATPRVIHNDGQAMPKGAQKAAQGSRKDRRHLKREAVKELMDVTRRTVVVAHLHPRWLRQCVEGFMDKGAEIDMEWVERLRALGPDRARYALGVFGG